MVEFKSPLEEEIIEAIKTVFDPEIPVNVYDIGLIYEINIDQKKRVEIVMTLTSPNCPAADNIIIDVQKSVSKIKGIRSVKIELTFEPTWDKSMMTEEALLELGLM